MSELNTAIKNKHILKQISISYILSRSCSLLNRPNLLQRDHILGETRQ